jgi:hypothetical protein
MRCVLPNELAPPKQQGRHNVLPDDAEAHIIAWIARQAGKSQPITRIDNLHYCIQSFG